MSGSGVPAEQSERLLIASVGPSVVILRACKRGVPETPWIKEEPEEKYIKKEEEEEEELEPLSVSAPESSAVCVKTEESVFQQIQSEELSSEPEPQHRKFSTVWDHFHLLTASKVKCRICDTELSYINKSTSSMLRHYRAKHENEELNGPRGITTQRRIMLDKAVLNFVIQDCQPPSLVESEGFKKLAQALDPTYILPSRKIVKEMLAKKHAEELERVKVEIQKAVAVSVTADMWTSFNMEAYLALTGHYIDGNMQLCTSVLGVKHLSQGLNADSLAQFQRAMMDDWGITNKVKCLVTDASPNMIASARTLQIRHSVCIAHKLNLLVKKSWEHISELLSIRNKSRQIVSLFRSNTKAKEKLAQVQQKMGRPTLKLTDEVSTRWSSTYQMLSRLQDEQEPVRVSLASLKTNIAPFAVDELDTIRETLIVLAPFHHATVELSEEKRVSGSKVIPMMKMLCLAIERNSSHLHTPAAKDLHDQLRRRVTEATSNLESLSVLTLSTLLDPRFKSLGFRSSSKCNEAINRLKMECASLIRATTEPQPGPSNKSSPTSDNLWQQLDEEVGRQTTNATAESIIEVQRYLAEPNITRTMDPLTYWANQKWNYPNLYKLSLNFLCTPASSVPCEQVFSKIGDIISKKRNCLNGITLEWLTFLNKNM